MKNFNFFTLIFIGCLIMLSFSIVCGQDQQSPEQTFDQKERPNLLAELDLSPEQIRQIRLLNRERQPLVRAARQRMKDANLALDQAVYADSIDESLIQTRLKEAQMAQAEFTKIRSFTEFAVRKILTPEQLVKFREVRLKFMDSAAVEARRNQIRKRRMNNSNQRFNNRLRKLPVNNWF